MIEGSRSTRSLGLGLLWLTLDLSSLFSRESLASRSLKDGGMFSRSRSRSRSPLYPLCQICNNIQEYMISLKQCCRSGMFIPDLTFFHHGSRIRNVSIPDPGSSKNLSILTPKKLKKGLKAIKNMIWVVHPGSGCWLSTHPGSRIKVSKRTQSRIPDPQHCFEGRYYFCLMQCGGSGIPDPDFYPSRIQKQQRKTLVQKNLVVTTFFWSHKFHKI